MLGVVGPVSRLNYNIRQGTIPMATKQSKLQDWGIDEATHPALVKCCTPAEREQMIRDDLYAGWSISLELMAVVALGLTIGIVAVVCTI